MKIKISFVLILFLINCASAAYYYSLREHFILAIAFFIFLTAVEVIALLKRSSVTDLILCITISFSLFFTLFNDGIYYRIMNYLKHKDNIKALHYDADYDMINEIIKNVKISEPILYKKKDGIQFVNYYIFPRKILLKDSEKVRWIIKDHKENGYELIKK